MGIEIENKIREDCKEACNNLWRALKGPKGRKEFTLTTDHVKGKDHIIVFQALRFCWKTGIPLSNEDFDRLYIDPTFIRSAYIKAGNAKDFLIKGKT